MTPETFDPFRLPEDFWRGRIASAEKFGHSTTKGTVAENAWLELLEGVFPQEISGGIRLRRQRGWRNFQANRLHRLRWDVHPDVFHRIRSVCMFPPKRFTPYLRLSRRWTRTTSRTRRRKWKACAYFAARPPRTLAMGNSDRPSPIFPLLRDC